MFVAKFTVLFIAFGVAFANPFAASVSSSEILTKLNPYLERYEQKERVDEAVAQFLEFCSLSEDDLDGAFDKVIENLEKLDDENEQTLCETIKGNLYNVLEPAINLLDTNCNKKHNIGPAAEYAVKTIQEIVEQACKSTGEELLELLNPCAFKDDTDDKVCIEKVLEPYGSILQDPDNIQDTTLTHIFCGIGEKIIDDCLKPSLNRNCQLEITKKSVLGFAEASLKNCPAPFFP